MNFLQKIFNKQQLEQPGVDIEEQGSIGMAHQGGGGEITRYILETADILEELEHKLRGNVWSESKRRWIQRGKPLLNNYGVNRIILLMSNFINRHIALSNFSEEDVKRIAYEIRIELIKVFRLEWYHFEVEKSMMSLIIRMIDASVYSMLKRAYKGGERDSLGQRYKHIEAPVFNNRKMPNL